MSNIYSFTFKAFLTVDDVLIPMLVKVIRRDGESKILLQIKQLFH